MARKRPAAPPPPSPSAGRRLFGCGAKLASLGLAGGFVALVGGLVCSLVGAWAYQEYVVLHPGPHLDREHIQAIIAQETPVLYADGVTPVGVFFEQEHRQHVSFDDMPLAYVMGIVAAEDGDYWTHPGINVRGIVRAMRDNLLAGSVVAGGSTLTQQTAKNIYYRPDRSPKAKGIELLNALRLEAHYSKAEILELYANQFHVTGNGRGLGIAARHFFDKEVSELDVVEAAFLAGLVKAPAYYDPYLGDEERRARAVERAHDRTRYVLRRLVEEEITALAGPRPDGTPGSEAAWEARLLRAGEVRAEAQRLLDEGFTLRFKRGAFRYDSSAVLDEVARRLEESPFKELLAAEGIDDPATAGLVVVTTLDPAIQAEATYALWHHLTEVGMWMEGQDATGLVLAGHSGPRWDPDHPPPAHTFRVARVTGRSEGGLDLDLGGHPCRVDRDGVVRVAVASKRGRTGDKNAKASSAEVDAFVEALPDGAVVLVSIREAGAADRPAVCDLELRPELQGASLVVREGRVMAMVGGNDNRNFNRATALRQYGSTWKPLVFHAAMQLGWSPDDVLDNRRNYFPYSTTFYTPRPDHDPAPFVSMSWAGVNSENLASIWLLYHLTDRLDGEQVRALARSLDLAQRPDEDPKAYRTRIQEAGVLPTRNRLPEAFFLQARHELLAGLRALPHPEDEVSLRSLLYGFGFAAERSRIQREGASSRAWKEQALDANWLTLRSRVEVCRPQHEALVAALAAGRPPEPDLVPDLTVFQDADGLQVACGVIPEGYVAPDASFVASLDEVTEPTPPDADPGEARPLALPGPAPRRRWPWQRDTPALPTPEDGRPTPPEPDVEEATVAEFSDLLVDDRLHVSTLLALDAAMERRELAMTLEGDIDLYDPQFLYWHQDFRVLLALRHLSALAEQYGVQTDLQEVLSLPLGASEITLEEAAAVYQGIVSGQAWSVPGKGRRGAVAPIETPTALIQEIRDVDGHVLYQATPTPTQVTDPLIGELTAHILGNVVAHGTGRRALGAVKVGETPVPVGGKTGTTNDFKNAAFLGFVPSTLDGAFTLGPSWIVASYVGYDDNRPMENGRIKLAGASGALPAWIGAAQGVANGLPNASGPLIYDEALVQVAAAEGTGLVDEPTEASEGMAVLVRRARVEPAPEVAFEPIRRPHRLAPRTEEALEDDGSAPPRRRRPARAVPGGQGDEP